MTSKAAINGWPLAGQSVLGVGNDSRISPTPPTGGGDIMPTPVLLLDFTKGVFPSAMTFNRNSTATDLLYVDTAISFNSFANNTPRFRGVDGIIIEEARTQYLLNNTAPANQTVTLAAGYYCLWMIGTGSVAMSAGTAVGTGFGSATQGAPKVVSITTGGTVLVVNTGQVLVFQLESGPGPSSFIPTTTASKNRGADIAQQNMTGIWNYLAGTFCMEFKYLSGGSLQTNNHLDGIVAGNGGCLFSFFHNNDLTQSAQLVGDGAVLGSNLIYPTQLTFAAWHKVASGWGSPKGQQMAVDGRPTATSGAGNASDPTFTLSTMTLFNENNSKEGGSGLIRSWKFWNTQIADAALSALTA